MERIGVEKDHPFWKWGESGSLLSLSNLIRLFSALGSLHSEGPQDECSARFKTCQWVVSAFMNQAINNLWSIVD